MAQKNNFDIILNTSRSFGGYEEITSSADLATWQGIVKYYSQSDLTSSHGKITIYIDWSPAETYARKLAELYSQPPDVISKTITENPNFFANKLVCQAMVEFEENSEHFRLWTGNDLLEHFLYELFLLANLATPGCFNLYRSYIRVPKLDPTKDVFAQTELELSEYLFESAWHEAQQSAWLKVGFQPFENVLEWYRRHNIGFRQVAKTNIERALFSLLHLSRREFFEPEATLWIASALEAVFDTPHGSSFQYLNNRISNLLVLSDKEKAILKKKLREFYDIRNGFVHGGGVICHPLTNEAWDGEVDEVVMRIIQSNNFAVTILLSSVQELIRNNSVGFMFTETIKNIPFNKTP
ncbi:MAG TPA: hypothetical protein VK959_01650 [Methylophilaceae bacterium]|jgi:hypothetical protein|nr:hypothetical protein [Methylophilaceae bacterium]